MSREFFVKNPVHKNLIVLCFKKSAFNFDGHARKILFHEIVIALPRRCIVELGKLFDGVQSVNHSGLSLENIMPISFILFTIRIPRIAE